MDIKERIFIILRMELLRNFDDLLQEAEERFADSPFVATTDDGHVVGFFCFSVNLNTNEGYDYYKIGIV